MSITKTNKTTVAKAKWNNLSPTEQTKVRQDFAPYVHVMRELRRKVEVYNFVDDVQTRNSPTLGTKFLIREIEEVPDGVDPFATELYIYDTPDGSCKARMRYLKWFLDNTHKLGKKTVEVYATPRLNTLQWFAATGEPFHTNSRGFMLPYLEISAGDTMSSAELDAKLAAVEAKLAELESAEAAAEEAEVEVDPFEADLMNM